MTDRRTVLCAVGAMLIALIAALGPGNAHAAASPSGTEARQVVQMTVDRAIAILRQPVGPSREAAFLKLFRDEFATTAIGRFVLGGYRSDASPAQFERYISTLETLVAKTTAARLSGYAGETVEIGAPRADGRRWFVPSHIAPKDRQPVSLDWILAPTKSGLKVVDLRVENLSLAITQRDEFAAVLQANGGNIDKLIDFMNDKIKKLDAGAVR